MPTDYDPSKNVEITRAEKRGDWYSVDGVANGKRVHVDIPAPSVEGRGKSAGERLMKRSLLGTAMSNPRED
jgi:hypothetical protein